MGLGIVELLIILLIIVLFFGARKLPELARALGQAKREFEKSRQTNEPPHSAP
ncbi:MAG: twin-arginine translocase TatA/TatE family subunit [Meiothermus sp.]